MTQEPPPIPWWIFLLRGELARVEPLVSTSFMFRIAKYEPSDIAFVSGKGWTGLYGYRTEPAPLELADEIVRELKIEVVVLDLGDVSNVRRQVAGKWEMTLDSRPDLLAREKGMQTPWLDDAKQPKRAVREATVIPAVGIERMISLGVGSERLLSGPEGIVILGDESRAVGALSHMLVTRFLDDGEFIVYVLEDGKFKQFSTPPPRHVPALTSIAGETEPRAIVRALGIPEDWMFPPDDN